MGMAARTVTTVCRAGVSVMTPVYPTRAVTNCPGVPEFPHNWYTLAVRRVTVIEQVQQDFPADNLSVSGFYLYVGERTRAFINIDADEVFFTRADSNRGRNYVLFLVMFLYNRFRLLPARGTLSHTLISEIEIAKVRSFHARMQRFGQGLGYYEFWDGTQWRVKAVPFADPDFRVLIPLPPPGDGAAPGGAAGSPRAGARGVHPGSEEAWEPLEELEQVPGELPGPAEDPEGSSAGTREG
jgi:hypothetical protein